MDLFLQPTISQSQNKTKRWTGRSLWLLLWVLFPLFGLAQPVVNTGSYTVPIGATQAFFNDFTNAASGTVTNNGTLYFLRNLTNNGTYTSSATGADRFEGTVAQTIAGSTFLTFNNVTLNNSNGLTIDNEVRVGGTFTFTNGLVITNRITPTDQLHFRDGSSYTGENNARHVNGYVCKTGNDAFTFPVGDGTTLRPVSITAPANVTDKLCAAYFNGDPSVAALPSGAPFATTSFGAGVTAVSDEEYWDVDGAATVSLTLTWDAASDLASLVPALANLIVVGWDGTKWVDLGNAGTTGNLTAGSITSDPILPNTYRAFTFGFGNCPPIAANIAGASTICQGTSTNLSVAILGGVGPYTVVYTDGTNNFQVDNYASNAPIAVSPATTTSYTLVSVTDAGGCPHTSLSGSATVTVQTTSLPTAFAGFDATILDDDSYTLADAVATNFSSVQWTTAGSGSFDNSTVQNPTYTPGAGDISAGMVNLTLSVTGTGVCASKTVTDVVKLTIVPKCLPNAFDQANFGNLLYPPASTAAIQGNYTNTASGTIVNQGTVSYIKNLVNNGSYDSQSGTDIFEGCQLQTIDGTAAPALHNAELDNANGLIVATEVQVKNQFTFTTGMATTNRANAASDFVRFLDNATATGTADSRHVDGYVCKTGNDAFTFPIGSATALRPVTITAPGSATDAICAAYFSGDPGAAAYPTGGPFPTAAKDVGITGVSQVEYWDVNGAASVAITLTWNAASNVNAIVTDLNDLRIVGWDGAQWVDVGTASFTGTLTSGTITSNAIVPNTYSIYTFGANNCPDIAAALSGDATVCVGQSTNLTVNITNGTAPYQVVYNNGSNNITVNNYNSGDPITVTPATNAVYTLVSVLDAQGCPATTVSGTATVNVETITIPAAYAGLDATIVENSTYTISDAAASNGTIQWTSSGDGTFDDATLQNPTYTPGANDISAGVVTLTLQVTGTGACASTTVSDMLTLNITPKCPPAAFDVVSNVPVFVPDMSSISYGGNFTNNGGVTNDGTIYFYKNLTNNNDYYSREDFIGPPGPQGKEIFIGCQQQVVSGTEEVRSHDTELDNSAGLILQLTYQVENLFTFTNGIVETDRAFAPNFFNGRSLYFTGDYSPTPYLGANDARHVDGYVSASLFNINAFVFPIGDGTALRPASVSNLNGSTENIFAAYFRGDPNAATLPTGAPFPTTSLAAGVYEVSTVEYWHVRDAEDNTGDLTLTWDANSNLGSILSDLNDLVIVGWDDNLNQWVNLGNAGGVTGTLTNGSVTATGVPLFDTYAVFTLGRKSPFAPGCADNLDALVWLRGDQGATSAQWDDASGNLLHATQATPANQPATGGLLNFNPALDFDGDDFFEIPLNINPTVSGRNAVTILMVYNADATGRPLWGNEDGGEDRYLNMDAVGDGVAPLPFTEGNVASQPRLVSVVLDEATANGSNIFINGTATASAGFPFTQNSSQGGLSTLLLGKSAAAQTTNLFDGRVAEFAVYQGALTAAQRNQAESYLALKYGLTLNSGTSDYVASDGTTVIWNVANNGVYNNHIAGIGRDDCPNLNQKQSRSVNSNAIVAMGLGTIAVDNPSNANVFTTDKSFLFWASSQSALPTELNQVASNADLPASLQNNARRLDAEWKVDETATVGNVQVRFDLTGITLTGTTLNNLRLLIDRDGDGDFTTGTVDIVNANAFTPGVSATFNTIDFADGDVFTLASAWVNLDVTVFLQGSALAAPAGFMRNDLQTYGTTYGEPDILPTTDPYQGTFTYANINNPAGTVGALVDWIEVQIRSVADPNIILERQSLLLQTDGEAVDVNGGIPAFTPQLEPVHIVVRHRNHLPVVSQVQPNFTGNVAYDFTTAVTQSYKFDPPGDPDQQVLVNGKWCMWGADVFHDGFIDSNDRSALNLAVLNGVFGQYVTADAFMDGFVDANDRALNTFNVISGAFSSLAAFGYAYP